MNDAMNAPGKIWTTSTTGKCHVGFDTPSENYATEYTRSDLIPSAAYVAGLEAALRACVAAIEHADMADGVCCCGDDMLYHSSPMSCGHTPTDLGEYNAAMVVAVAEKALSARPNAPDVRTVTVAQLERLLNTLAELDGHTKLDDEIRDSVIEEIRAIIGGMK